MIDQIFSDRERDGLNGPVKSVADEYSTSEFYRDGKMVEWRGNRRTDVWSEGTERLA